MTASPATDGSPTRMRATHADRDHFAALIEASVADGALAPAEGEERTQAVRSAIYRDELAAFVADLPVAQPPPPAAVPAVAEARTGRARAFVAGHRALSWVLAALLVLVLLVGGFAVGSEAFGGGGHHDRGGSHEQMHDRSDR